MTTPGWAAHDGQRLEAYCGIDVAFARAKRLPVCVAVGTPDRLVPLRLRDADGLAPPRGHGNPGALDAECLAAYAEEVAAYLRAVETRFGVAIRRVAVDAPRDHAPDGGRRAAELALDAAGISCFATPDRPQFAAIRARVAAHLGSGGKVSHLPHANQLRMLVGFALFARLEREFECVEVYPHAIVHALDPRAPRKATAEGLRRRLALVGEVTGADSGDVERSAWGARHDRIDAVLSAWVASLPLDQRTAVGDGGRDSIWLPRSPSMGATVRAASAPLLNRSVFLPGGPLWW